jgi:hypothetical protein
MSDVREYVGIISQRDFMTCQNEFEIKIRTDAKKSCASLGYVVKDQFVEWIKKPSDPEGGEGWEEWACRVLCIVEDHLEEVVRNG